MSKLIATMLRVMLSICLISLLVAALTMIHGLVVFKLWGWFVVPLGMPVLTFTNAIGLGLFTTYLSSRVEAYKPKEMADNQYTMQFMKFMVQPFTTLLMGWIIHQFQ